MKHFKIFAFFLLAMFVTASTYAFASEPAGVIWWELKADPIVYSADLSRDEILAALEKPKTLILRQGTFPLSGKDESAPGQSLGLDDARVWIRNPDGVISEINPSRDNGTIALNLPSDLNAGELNGRYLVGVHLDAGVIDCDSDSIDERVHLYSNFIVNYHKQDGAKGENPDVFFKDEDKIALEIGPVDARGIGEMPYIKAGYQEALRHCKMKVIYRGRPLANAEVAVLTESGWDKSAKTNSKGLVSITPIENRQREEKCLYVVTHRDMLSGEYHCSSLLMFVLKPPPGWMSKAEGFVFWAVMGTGLFIVYVVWVIYRKKRRDMKIMLEFDGHKIRRE